MTKKKIKNHQKAPSHIAAKRATSQKQTLCAFDDL